MSERASLRLTPGELAIKMATRDAVRAAGGQEFVAGEVGRAQSRISEWCSETHPDFMPAHIVAKVEALGAGSPGHPHITHALARAAGGHVRMGEAVDDEILSLAEHLPRIATESSDVIRLLAECFQPGRSLSPRQLKALLREVDQLVNAAMELRDDLTSDEADHEG